VSQTKGLAGGRRADTVRVFQRVGGGRRRRCTKNDYGRRPDHDAAYHGHQQRDAAANVTTRRVADAAALSAAGLSPATAAGVHPGRRGRPRRRPCRLHPGAHPAQRVQRLYAAGVGP